jgi:predicted RNase H-like HicB family nuclease
LTAAQRFSAASKRTITIKRTSSASVRREGTWYVAQCLELDVVSQGESEEEALENLREAIELYFEPPGPTATPHVRTIEVEVSAA